MSSTFNPNVFIPSNLDIELHISNFPPTEIPSFCPDKLIYIVSLINSIPSNNKSLYAPDAFIHLYSAKLKCHVWDYRLYLDYLLRTGILESDHFYIPGEKSYGYRYTSTYNTILKPVTIKKYTLRKIVKEHSTPELKRNKSDLGYLAKWFTPALQINVPNAYDHLAKRFHEVRVEIGDYKARRKYSLQKMSVDRFALQDFYFLKDDSVGRLHTNLTNIKSSLRNFITYDGQNLVSVDIKNSQPFLCNTFLNEGFFNSSSKGTNDYSLFSNISNCYSLSIFDIVSDYHFKYITSTTRLSGISSLLMRGKYELSHTALEFQQYQELTVEGRLYQYIQSEVLARSGKLIPLGKPLKEVMFTVMFTANNYIGQPEAEPKRIFRSLFPYMYELLSLIKKDDASTLPRLLQSIEAKIMLDRVCYRISVDNPYLPIFTIHDSVTCPVGFEDYVATVIREEMVKAIGISPSLKYEYWTPNALHT